MIALKLVFQSLAGVGAVVGVAGSGYYVINKTEASPSENIIVLFSTSTVTDQQTDSEGYICKVNSSTSTLAEDNKCQIYTFSVGSPKTTLDFESIIANPTNKVSGKLITSKKYILTISKTAFDSVTGADKTIEIFNKKTPTSSLIKFSPKLTLEGTVADPKPNLIFAQAFNLPSTPITETLATDKKYFCEFLDEATSNKFECDLYKTTTTSGIETTDTELKNSTKTTTSSDITKGKYFVIGLKTQSLAKSQLRNKKIKLSIGDSSTSLKEVATFLYEQSLVGDLTSENKFVYTISPSREIYYVVQASTTANALSTPELTTTNAGGDAQNYKCQLDTAVDTSCKLFTLPAFTSSKNSVTHAEVLAATTTPKISDFVDGNYFKISLNPSNVQPLTWDGSAEKTITIVSTDTTAKTYATLKIIAKEEKEKIIGKASLVLGKIKEVTAGTATTFKCSIVSGTNESCDAYIFDTALTANQTTQDLKFQAMTAITTLAKTNEGKYVLLDLKTQKLKFEDLKTSEITVSVSAEPTSTTTKFILESLTPLVGTASATKTQNKVIFLN